ncbi:zinc finger protein 664-like isoform X2 [Diorhabda sublineata]|uniref:zinc finger protein 664-like isoform X2 n=1 Tax=Diorhabda sublineata TaxID=1163346 RepID=UPI0024E04141|nr:zinc finger protein 664-like isoform X2 [Diorhabda sublineata]
MEECELRNICRACLTEQGQFQSVFVPESSSGISLHISEMMSACSSVQVTLGDGLPEQICKSCVADTINFYLFKLKCEKSDKILRENLKKSTVMYEQEFIKCDVNTENKLKNEIDVDKNEENQKQLDQFDVFDTYSNYSDENSIEMKEEELPIDKPKIKEFECDICRKQFTRNDLLLRHRIAHAMKMENHNMDFAASYQLDQDDEDTLDIKKEDYVYACNRCETIFLQKEDLDVHLKSHLKEQYNVGCQFCQRKFSRLAHLNRHLRNAHYTEKHFKCEVCEKSFYKQEQLRHHMNGHSGLKPHICDICCKGARPFVCSVCNHGFTTSSSLTKHKRIHSGEKPYECDTCKMKFSRSGILARHKRTHTGEKPYKCKFCDKAFSQSNDLTSHQRIHTGEKPFICDECGQAFRQSSALKTHKKTHVEKGVAKTEKNDKATCVVEAKPIFLTGVFNTEFLPGF